MLKTPAYYFALLLSPVLIMQTGCRSTEGHRKAAEENAYAIIDATAKKELNIEDNFSIDRPSDILRRKLIEKQDLPFVSDSVLGADKLNKIQHWPDDGYPVYKKSTDEIELPWEGDNQLKLNLISAMQVAARNSREFQAQKETVFRRALDLDLSIYEFSSQLFTSNDTTFTEDLSSDNGNVTGLKNKSEIALSRKFTGGTNFSTSIGIDWVSLLAGDKASSFGIFADTSISIPLLRGAGRHIAREGLTQAERNVVYALLDFIRFKQAFAVRIADEYFDALKEKDRIVNAKNNFDSLDGFVERAQSLAEAGRLSEISVDQAMQDRLRALEGLISAESRWEAQLDKFKNILGLPVDAAIALDSAELKLLVDEHYKSAEQNDTEKEEPLLINEQNAIQAAFENRPDLKKADARLEDAQRAIVIAADQLRAEITIGSSATMGGRKNISAANSNDTHLRPEKGVYTGLLNIDLPFDRRSERNDYRKSLIALEASIRDLQEIEDSIKLDIRSDLRQLKLTRQKSKIQAESLELAKRRVESTRLFVDAGRAEVRDLLEAENSLLSAKNDFTSSLIDYRIAQLEIQRDMGVLELSNNGIWEEYDFNQASDKESEE